MTWRDWSYARKGGIIGVILMFVLSITLGATGITASITHTTSDLMTFFTVFLSPGILAIFPIAWSISIMHNNAWIGIILFGAVILISVTAWYFLGTLIGWIVGRIKQR